jgi:hypothetical protein
MTKPAVPSRDPWNDLAELEARLEREARILADHRARQVAEDLRARYESTASGARRSTIPPPPAVPSFAPGACACAHVREHAPSLQSSRGRIAAASFAVAGGALAMSILALATRYAPVASAHSLDTTTVTPASTSVAVARPVSTEATDTVAMPAAVALLPSAGKKAATRGATVPGTSPIVVTTTGAATTGAATTGATTANGVEPAKVDAETAAAGPTASAGETNTNEARLEQAARTAAMLREQLDATP